MRLALCPGLRQPVFTMEHGGYEESPHKYGFWDWRLGRMEADAIMIIMNLKLKKEIVNLS